MLLGIELRSGQYTKIYENDFYFNDGEVGRTGIYNLGSSDFVMAENRFNGDDYYRGVYSNKTSSLRPWQYYRNQFFMDGDPYTEAFPNTDQNRQLQFRCNITNDEMGTILVYSGGVAANQGFLNDPAGNVFNASCYASSSPHLWKNTASDGFKYYHHSIPGTMVPDDDCINDLSSFIKENTQIIFNSGAECLRSYTQPNLTIVGIGDPIRGKSIATEGIIATLDDSDHWGLIGFVRDVSANSNAATLTELNNAGMLSDKVILEVLQHRPGFDREDLAGVLLNNYPLSYWVLSEVEKLDPPLPADSLTKIYQYQDSSSVRGEKMDSIYALMFEKSILYDRWMLLLTDDSTHNIQELRDTLEKETDPGFLALLADLYMIDSSYANVDDILDTLPVYSKEIRDWVDLRRIQLTFEEQGWVWADIEGEGEASSFTDDLDSLATNTTVAGLQARHIYHAFFEDTVSLVFEEKDSYKKGIEKEQPKTAIKPQAQSYIKMFPNPANNTVIIQFDLGESEMASLELYDILGNLVKKIELSKKKGEVFLDVASYPIGTYLYRAIGISNEVLPVGRLLIIR